MDDLILGIWFNKIYRMDFIHITTLSIMSTQDYLVQNGSASTIPLKSNTSRSPMLSEHIDHIILDLPYFLKNTNPNRSRGPHIFLT